MVRPAEAVISEIREKVDIVDLISEYVNLKKVGRDYVGLCPFHQERTPSFTVSREKGMFYCFGCHTGGNAFNFLMKKEGMSFTESVSFLAKRAGIDVSLAGPWYADPRKRGERTAILDVLEDAASVYHEWLIKDDIGAKAREYLTERGMSSESLKEFRLGYAPPGRGDLIKALGKRGFTVDVMEKAGLIVSLSGGERIDRFRDRIMFPIWDRRGAVIGFGGRAIGQGHVFGPKYLNSPETPVFSKRNTWYGWHKAVDELRRKEKAIVVEGYIDFVSVYQAGVRNVVASLGTALSEEQAHSLSRVVGEVLIAYDGDSAGESATLRGLEYFDRYGCEVKVVRFPQGDDPDSFVRSKGVEAFLELVESAVPLVEYRLSLAERGVDLATTEGKALAARRMAAVLASLGDELRRDLYTRKVARELAISEAALEREIVKQRQKATKTPRREHISTETRNNNRDKTGIEKSGDWVYRFEWELLRLLIRYPSVAERVWNEIEPGEFREGVSRRVAEGLFRLYREGNMDTSSLVDGLDEEAAAAVSRFSFESVEFADPHRAADDMVTRWRNVRLKGRIREISARIRDFEKRGEEIPLELLVELTEMQRRLKQGEWTERGEGT